MNEETIFAGVLAVWKHGIDVHDPIEVGTVFAEDALFQGAHPEPSRGRASVVDYYDGQPPGLGVDYEIIDARRSADDVITGYAAADFTSPGEEVVHRHVTMVLERTGDRWLVGHYHVSLKPAGFR
ncbi:SgcJ/EcaC family oxidoreductase [Herbidospora mongoliensis]|uniref:SgcJ/EcaC family oxidoreductase n=1 Tax=Herbidospora mongoliensis TaxID=688067 RepID=UPI00082F7AFF|nr:SgcJ/EcaC family oxidoreductase [Herbidospora mongoliensis]